MRWSADSFRSILVGAAAGLIAAFVSKRFQDAWNDVQERATGGRTEGGEGQDDPAPVQLADRVALAVEGEPVPRSLREPAGALVHYLTGAGLGATYGLLAEAWPPVTSGFGMGYGLATDMALDEALLPALGLAPRASETPPIKHAYALATHLVFGLVLEGSRRALGAALRR